MKLPKLEYDAKIEYLREKDNERKRAIMSDIDKIDRVIAANTGEGDLEHLHRELDGKYQACIAKWGLSMYGYNDTFGFNYEFLGESSLRDNLLTMKPKLEAYMQGWNNHSNTIDSSKSTSAVNVTVNNSVSISVSFMETRQKIEGMNALSREQSGEILEKVDELEKIHKEASPRKTKWDKVKPIISFAMDKGVDVAIAILSLIVQMKLTG